MELPLAFTGAVTAGNGVLTSFGGVSLLAAGSGNAAVTAQLGGRNPNFNRGFLDRVTVFQNASRYVYTPSGTASPAGSLTNAYGAHTYYYEAIIPLKLLHDRQRKQQRSSIMPHNNLCA